MLSIAFMLCNGAAFDAHELQVDFGIALVSLLALVLQMLTKNAQALMVLRALRAIKPIRMLTRSSGMRIVFRSLVLSLASMGSVTAACVLFMAIFAITGCQLFKGLFARCGTYNELSFLSCAAAEKSSFNHHLPLNEDIVKTEDATNVPATYCEGLFTRATHTILHSMEQPSCCPFLSYLLAAVATQVRLVWTSARAAFGIQNRERCCHDSGPMHFQTLTMWVTASSLAL
jgi:hypothetical protein